MRQFDNSMEQGALSRTHVDETIHMSMSPHARSRETTATIMRDVLIALIPACLMGVYTFGWYVLAILSVSIASCVLTEWLYEFLTHRPNTVRDLSAMVTGVILAVNLPATVPLWIPALGGVFATLVVKQLFGGLGCNIMNPALAARCFLLISFAGVMTAYSPTIRTLFESTVVSGATPLAYIKEGGRVGWFEMLLNTHNGSIGESSVVAILLGAIYLVIRRVITLRIPLVYVGSTILWIVLIHTVQGTGAVVSFDYLFAHVCGGGLLIGAFFMANDYVTCPITAGGQWVYAVMLGLLTALFRVLGSSSEGVSYSIIIANLFVPLIERMTMPRPFGVPLAFGGKRKNGKKVNS